MVRNWENLTGDEKARYMQMQMSHRGGNRSPYLPDDCSECPICSTPVLGYGWCRHCSAEFNELEMKLLSPTAPTTGKEKDG